MNRIGLFALMMLATLALGCSGGGPDIGTVKASGTVTYKGAPVEGAQVAFLPDGSGRAAAATTDASGRFTLNTAGSGDGAIPGSYKVIVTKVAPNTAAPAGSSQEGGAAASVAGGQTAAAQDLLPAKYKNPATSGLTAKIDKGAKNDFTFELKD
ncbi:MAG: carboxypeptidase-like regulatory domain-containing protein [Thermoguttaceae bacterium]|jgi:hypothetical protein